MNSKKIWKAAKITLAICTMLEMPYTFSTPILANGGGQSDTVNCGKEEHTHSDECYEKVLTCTIEDEEHVHTDECYTSSFTCTKEEHTHTEKCYEKVEDEIPQASSEPTSNPTSEATAETTFEPSFEPSIEPTADATEDAIVIDNPTENPVIIDATDDSLKANTDIQDTITISISVNEESKYHNPTKDDNGTYLYYTGEAPIVYLNVSNPTGAKIEEDDGTVVRLYMKFTDTEAGSGRTSVSGSPNQGDGEYTIKAKSGTEYKYTVTKVEDGIYCFEIARPINGDTVNLSLASIFPNATSSGGTNEVWAVILTKEEKEALDVDGKKGIANKPSDGSNQVTLKWETKEDEYKVDKSFGSTTSSLVGDTKGGAYITGLSWKINFSRATQKTLEGVGKDHVRYVEYTDTITLPTGAEWSSYFSEIINNNTYICRSGYYNSYYGLSIQDKNNNEIVHITVGSWDEWQQIEHEAATLELTDDNKLIIKWKIYNSDFNDKTVTKDDTPSKDFSAPRVGLILCDNAIFIQNPTEDTTYTVRNDVTTDVNYSWASNKNYTAYVEKDIQIEESKLTMKKTRNNSRTYFGATGTYEITAKNEGVLPYTKLAYIEDSLPNAVYLTAGNMVSLFSDANYGDKLTINISNATICETPVKKTVTKIDGTAESIAVGNTSNDGNANKYNGMQSVDPTEIDTNANISIYKDNGKLVIKYNEQEVTCDLKEESLQEALDNLGFINTNSVIYKLTWNLGDNDNQFKLIGGEEISFNIPFRFKNTFMFLNSDSKGSYPSTEYYVSANTAYAYSIDNKQITYVRESSSVYISREYYLSKNAITSDGASLDTMPEDGKIIQYTLNVQNKNRDSTLQNNNSEFVPLVDHMSGVQILLAKVSENKDKDWAKELTDSDVYTDDKGNQYYKLSKAGTYQNVTINGLVADSVVVTKTTSGLDTLIKWYFDSTYNSSGQNFTYQSLVDGKGLLPNASKYTLDNESWLGDHEKHRLYANMDNISVTTFSFDKKIVSQDDILATEKESGNTNSIIKNGNTVYYRLTFYPNGNAYTISGSNIIDALPLGLVQNDTEYLKWNKNESLESGSVWIEGYQGYKNIQNEDSYSIENDANNENQQYIKWGNDFSITVGDSPVYIYVRLTFPTDANWQEYCATYGSTKLNNTFYAYGVPSSVSHDLQLPAKAYLQKGVYANLYYLYNSKSSVSDDCAKFNTNSNSLFYYSNNDGTYKAVAYYAVLYNDGNTRLYVQDMQDILPKGFTIRKLVNTTSNVSNSYWKQYNYDLSIDIGNIYGYQVAKANNGTQVKWKYAHLDASADPENPQKITFRISQKTNSSYSSENIIKYDEARNMYYLDPGEGITFGYICATNEYDDTEDSALNSISMPYYDYNEGGVIVGDTSFTNNYYKSGVALNSNDGSCTLLDNNQASSMGYSGGSDNTQWLESNVTVVRGNIKPGITKALTSLITAKGDTVSGNIVAANPSDTLCWTVTADNDGDAPIFDYVLTDIMPKPYLFNGKVNYAISNGRQAYNGYLFEIGDLGNDGKVTLTSNKGSTFTKTLEINGESQTLNVYWSYRNQYSLNNCDDIEIDVQIKETDTDYILYIRFKDKNFALGEHQSGLLSVNTKNIENSFVNTVYVNHCYITPMKQTWDGTVNKGNYTTLDVFNDEKMSTVKNGAPVTTSYGYTTSSMKSVKQYDDDKNTAKSTDSTNYIVLPNKEKEFTYTLSIENAEQAIGNLVIIDGLPEVGDHSSFQNDDARYSEFKVKLADDIGINVSVKLEDGTINELTSDKYVVEYSTKTDFDAKDWNGSSSWNTDSKNARSIRIKISDETGNLIPAKSTVNVSFNAVVDGEAKPGQIAWNSFGYHYNVVNSSTELEAAPLKVGVMIPSVPTIQKSLVDESDNAIEARKDETFKYVIYTGSSLKNSNVDELMNAIASDSTRKFTIVETTVEKNASQTDKIALDNCKVYTYSNGEFVVTEEDFSWENGKQYTLLELPNNSIYEFKSINKNTAATGYTFTYTASQAFNLSVVNSADEWNFKVKKVDSEDSSIVLSDAYFALYSSYEYDKISNNDYEALSVKPEIEIEYADKTWYLTKVSNTGTDGTINWDNLGRDKYLLKEVKAPIRYELNDEIVEVNKLDEEQVITVENDLEYITVSAEKVWDDTVNEGEVNKTTRPETLTVNVKNGSEIVDTLILSEENDWSATSKNLLKYDLTGKEIDYQLVEESVEGYYANEEVNEDGVVTFTNTLTSVSISKVDQDLNALVGAKLQLFEGDSKIEEWTSSINPYVIRGLKVGTTYTIKEVEAPEDYLIAQDITFIVNKDGSVTTSAVVNDGVILMEDKPIEKIEFTVNKVWDDVDNIYNTRPDSIEVQLTQTLNGVTTNVGDAVTLTNGTWSYTWNDLPTTDENNNPITYKVVENSEFENYTSSISEDGKTITNALKTGNLKITKTISGSVTYDDLKDLYFEISGPDGYSKEVKLSEMTDVVSGMRSYTIEDLLPGEYTVVEKNAEVNGYSVTTTFKDGDSKEVTVDETASIDITNEYVKNEEPKNEEESKKDEPKKSESKKVTSTTTEYQLVRTDTH